MEKRTPPELGAVLLTDLYFPFLQLTDGKLQFRFSCGNASPASLLLRSEPLSDGQWHSVQLEVNSTGLRLTLDQQRPASAALTEPCRMMRAHDALLFASVAQDSAPEVQHPGRNFIGCLKGMELDGEAIRAGDAAEWTGSGSRRVFGVYRCCGRAGVCDHNPCQNGGVCEEDAGGGGCSRARTFPAAFM